MDDQCNMVSLKEHLLAAIAAERERTEAVKALFNLRFELADKALVLAHTETLRRLDNLNHSHEQAKQKEATFVRRDVYESQVKEHYQWRDEVNASLAARQGRSSVTTGVIGTVGGLTISALLGLIMYLTKVVLNNYPR